MFQDVAVVNGKSYRIDFTITDSVNNLNLILGATTIGQYGSGAHSIYVTKDANASARIFFQATSSNAFQGSLDNVSVKEVGQDWTLLNDVTSFSFENGIANIQGTANSANNGIKQDQISSVIGKTYKISATLRSNDGGLYRFRLLDGSYFDLGSGNSSEFETITSYHTATSTAFTILATSWYTSGTANFDISNISVIEITDDTNLPRIDYTGGEGHWLFEPQSTNLITQSENFSSVNWAKNRSLISSDVVTSPSGIVDADKFIGSSASGDKKISDTVSVVSGDKYTFSIFAKKAEFDGLALRLNTIGFPSGYVLFNLDTGVGTSIGEVDSFLSEDYGNGWWRLSATSTADATLNCNMELLLANNGAITYVGNNVDGVYIWGAQVEALSFATSYIPTSGSTVTRLQDAAFGAGSSDLINSTEGVLYAEIEALADDGTNRIISLFKDGDATNRINIFYTSGSNKMKFIVRINNTNVFNTSITLSDIANYNKVALSFKENEFKVYINGVKEAEQLSGSIYPINTLDKLNFDQSGGNLPFYGKTKCVAVFKEALTDDELECLTSDEISFSSFNALALANNYTII